MLKKALLRFAVLRLGTGPSLSSLPLSPLRSTISPGATGPPQATRRGHARDDGHQRPGLAPVQLLKRLKKMMRRIPADPAPPAPVWPGPR